MRETEVVELGQHAINLGVEMFECGVVIGGGALAIRRERRGTFAVAAGNIFLDELRGWLERSVRRVVREVGKERARAIGLDET